MPGKLIGRTAEREALRSHLIDALDGHPCVQLITGEAGIGKTRLVEELASLTDSALTDSALTDSGRNALMLTGESAPHVGTTLAYGPFAVALGDRADWLIADDPPTAMLTARHRQFTRVLSLLSRLSAQAPLVLVIEDMHWADESSRQLLSFLAVSVRQQPLFIVATVRDDDLDSSVRQWLTDLERLPRVNRLRLGRLAETDMGVLVRAVVPDAAGADLRAAIVGAADGIPLFARELAFAAPHWPPASISEALLARMANAPPDAVTVMKQIAVAGTRVPHEVLAAAVRMPEERLLAATRIAVTLRLLAVDGDCYTFHHEMTRQIVYSDLLPGERRLLHRKLAEALADQGAVGATAGPTVRLAQLAYHWREAGHLDRAAPAALEAARRAIAARAYPEAHRLYALAVELSGWLRDPDQVGAALEEAAQAAAWVGSAELAVTYTTQALEQTDQSDVSRRVHLLERLGRYHWQAGAPSAAVEATGVALALLGNSPPSALLAKVLAAHATGFMLLGEFDTAVPLATQAVETAELIDAPSEKAHALATYAILVARRGDLEAGLSALIESLAVARKLGSVEHVMRAASNHVYLLCTAGRFDEALNVAHEGRTLARSLGAPASATAMLDNNAAAVLAATGRWVEATDLLRELLAEQVDPPAPLQLIALELAVGRGDDERAEALSTSLSAYDGDPRLSAPLHASCAEHALYQADLGRATREVIAGLTALHGRTLIEQRLRLLTIGLRVAADIATRAGASVPTNLDSRWKAESATFLATARSAIQQQELVLPEVAAYLSLATAEDARGRGADNPALWRDAANAWHRASQPYREAYARLREAQAAARAGRRDHAHRALDACVGIARGLPAAPLLGLAEQFAQATRLPVSVADATQTASKARLGITDREAQVLSLLADGASNRQIARALFISERTVAVHVSHILDKLGARNRTEAASAAAQLKLIQPDPIKSITSKGI